MKRSTLLCTGLLWVAFAAEAGPRREAASGSRGRKTTSTSEGRAASGPRASRRTQRIEASSRSKKSVPTSDELRSPSDGSLDSRASPDESSAAPTSRSLVPAGEASSTSREWNATPVGEVSAAPPASARGWRDLGLHFRAGGLFIAPLGKSREVELTNVTGPAQLGVREGPIAGSGVGMGNNLMPAITVGYTLPWLEERLSVETILALPFTMKLYAEGTLANESLAPTVLGSVPTGVPALGRDLGEVKVLPPVLTAVARLFPRGARVNPYVGLGTSLLVTLDARVTNPVLTEVREPTMEVPAKLGWVVQGGVDVKLYERFFLTADFKYIGGLNLEARVRDIYVRLPNLPLYDSVRVGDNIARVSVDPIVLQLGVGMNL